MKALDPARKLFLANCNDVYAAIIEQLDGEIVRADVNVSILVFNAAQEEVEQWVN